MENNMSGVISMGRYRVAAVLAKERGYCALKCIDLSKKERSVVLINRYEGAETIREMLPVLDEARRADHKRVWELFTETGAVNAVFPLEKGVRLDTLYGKKACPTRVYANALAQSYFHGLLELAALPIEFLYAAAKCENVLVQEKARSASFMLFLPPSAKASMREVSQEVEKSISRLFPRRFTSLSYELDLLDELKEGAFDGPAALYGRWLEAAEGYKSIGVPYEEKVFVAKFLALLSDKWKRRKKLRAKKKAQKAARERMEGMKA
ncbi:hypothetical protein LJC27_02890 [Christensenellaceae bacterium OttesenSCG-928-M15]|nr:hypothetical protein [Christensenellaceae bacterium OttesenSCG-928-M15]